MPLIAPSAGIGDCVMTQHRDPATGEYSLTIDHADPVILISVELLQQVLEDAGHRYTRYAQVRLADMIPYEDIYLGATLRIDATNRTVIYRITRRHDEHTYVGEWPD